MNREELENEFDFRFCERDGDFIYLDKLSTDKEIKQFIFDTMIPEVLKSMLTETEVYNINGKGFIGYSEFKQKAKEQFNINL